MVFFMTYMLNIVTQKTEERKMYARLTNWKKLVLQYLCQKKIIYSKAKTKFQG